jgi:signal transduction histidine kinase
VASGLIERDPTGASPAPTEDPPSAVADGLPPCPYRELLTGLTHDLKNPLALIRGGAQLLDRRLRRPEPIGRAAVRAGLAQIEAASARMNLLLDDLLDAVSFGTEGAPVRPSSPVDLVRLARQAAARHQCTTERHVVRVESEEEVVAGFWDTARLERVLANLLSNALKFSPEGGEVLVTIRRRGRWVDLAVRDRGLGIPAADVGRVFDPFHRAGNVVGRVAGTGLGLPGVRRMVEAHGGTVDLTTREGVGTTVVVHLPGHDAPGTSAASPRDLAGAPDGSGPGGG